MRPVIEFVRCNLPTKRLIVGQHAESENCWAVRMISNWYFSRSETLVVVGRHNESVNLFACIQERMSVISLRRLVVRMMS